MEFKQIISDEALKLYNKYKKKGLISIYWYGSGLNKKDFNKNSDIDLIAIAKDSLTMKYEKEMIKELQKNKDLDIRIRILYLSELNGGKIKSNLATFLSIKLLLIEFKDYMLLRGKKFEESDFSVKKASYSEAIKLQRKIHLEQKERFSKNNKFAMYYIKSALYYFYFKTCKKKGYFNFSYDALSKNVLDEYRDIVTRLITIKDNNYNLKETKKIAPKLDRLILKK